MSSSIDRRKFISRSLSGVAATLIAPFSSFARPAGPFTILFQGDSITDGNRGRNEDPNHVMGHGYAFSIASELASKYPDRALRFLNRGVSGDALAHLAARWKTDTLELRPDVVSILAGINDVHAGIQRGEAFDAKRFRSQYQKLLGQTRQALPQSLPVLGEPFTLRTGMVAKDVVRWEDASAQAREVVRDMALSFDAVLLPYQTMFDKAVSQAPADYWIWDGIHPTYAGHGLMKNLWIDEVRKKCARIA